MESKFESVFDTKTTDDVQDGTLIEELMACSNGVVGEDLMTEATVYAFRDAVSRAIEAMAWVEFSPLELCPFVAVAGRARPPILFKTLDAVEQLRQTSLSAAANINADTCPCGNTYRADSNFCRKCGKSRGGARSAIVRDELRAFCIENLGEAQVAILTSKALTEASSMFIASLVTAGLEERDIEFAKMLVQYAGEFMLENDESIFISALSSITEHSESSEVVSHLEAVAMRVIGPKKMRSLRCVSSLAPPLNVVTTKSPLLEPRNKSRDDDDDDEEVDSALIEMMSMGDLVVEEVPEVTDDALPSGEVKVEAEIKPEEKSRNEEIIRSLFHRYDYDESGTINSEEELQQITSAVFFKIKHLQQEDGNVDVDVKGAAYIDELCQAVDVNENPMTEDEYVAWFHKKVG